MDSDFFGNSEKQWMINFRVADLEPMVRQLRNVGVDLQWMKKRIPMDASLSSSTPKAIRSSYASICIASTRNGLAT